MDVFTKYFARLVAANASQIFPGLNRPVANPGNYHLLAAEMKKLSREFPQARKIAESIETGTEDIFRDFDLSGFMEHFQLDALEKTLLALAFKLGTRTDLKTKGKPTLGPLPRTSHRRSLLTPAVRLSRCHPLDKLPDFR